MVKMDWQNNSDMYWDFSEQDLNPIAIKIF